VDRQGRRTTNLVSGEADVYDGFVSRTSVDPDGTADANERHVARQ